MSDAGTDAEALMRRVRTVLLDFDGPVCSIFAGYPAPAVAEELASKAAAAGHPVPADYLRNQDPLDVLRFAGTVGPELTALVERELTRAEVTAADTAEATPGAEGFLAACRSTGRTVAVVSNNSAAAVTCFLERAGWVDLVRLVEGRDPSDPALMKPHPHVLLRTLRDLVGPAESAVIVGDSVTDIEAGLAADVWTIGYANKPGKDEAMRDAGADVVLDSMAELAELTGHTPAP
jgi:phosphoglycolate phosphatase-like HAD superfamily hydrolase